MGLSASLVCGYGAKPRGAERSVAPAKVARGSIPSKFFAFLAFLTTDLVPRGFQSSKVLIFFCYWSGPFLLFARKSRENRFFVTSRAILYASLACVASAQFIPSAPFIPTVGIFARFRTQKAPLSGASWLRGLVLSCSLPLFRASQRFGQVSSQVYKLADQLQRDFVLPSLGA